jgi:hypothetical protein
MQMAREILVCGSAQWRHWNSVLGGKMLPAYGGITDSKMLELIFW